MDRLQQIKNEVATKHHYGYWVDLVAQNDLFTIDKYFTEVINQYAKECSQASLDEASENAELDFVDDEPIYGYVGIKEESITNPENIVLL